MDYCVPLGIPVDEFLMWPQRSQDAALSWRVEQSHRCPTCATYDWEWDENPQAYHAVQVGCMGCLARESEEEHLRKQPSGKGVRVSLVRGGRGPSTP